MCVQRCESWQPEAQAGVTRPDQGLFLLVSVSAWKYAGALPGQPQSSSFPDPWSQTPSMKGDGPDCSLCVHMCALWGLPTNFTE
jgi:hypothetical protein